MIGMSKQNMIVMAIIITTVVVITGYYIVNSGNVDTDTGGSSTESFLIGTWESDIINGYYVHQKVFNSDNTYTGTWLISYNRETYSQVSGTWSASCCTITTVTDHTDTYPYKKVNNDEIKISIDNVYRRYYRK